jgi:hypothetical protein
MQLVIIKNIRHEKKTNCTATICRAVHCVKRRLRTAKTFGTTATAACTANPVTNNNALR